MDATCVQPDTHGKIVLSGIRSEDNYYPAGYRIIFFPEFSIFPSIESLIVS